MTYYNEFDPFAANWLRNLSSSGLIAPGLVDDRSILEVESVPEGPAHFFAGIGVWSYALRLAGVPDDFPVWTGSCPCQPFSTAGKRKGEKDERHLWPEFRRLIAQHKPPIVFGEQVASPAGRTWLSAVRADLEALGYAVGASDLCAAGVGGPHIRQRLFFGAVRMADPCRPRREGHAGHDLSDPGQNPPRSHSEGCSRDGLGDADRNGAGGNPGGVFVAERESPFEGVDAWRIADRSFAPGALHDFWLDADWLLCRDPSDVPRWRPVQSGTFPLATRAPERMGRLRAYGNAIVAPVAAEFISAFLEAL